MSYFDYNRKYQWLKVQKRSGFDKSFKNLLTTKCGTITPILVDEIIPNTTIHLDAAINACLPPLASASFASVNLEVCSFFCPLRLLYGGISEWLCGEEIYGANGSPLGCTIPVLTVNSSSTQTAPYVGVGSLTDYLGYKITGSDANPTNYSTTNFNIFPLLAYHRIYADWYMNTVIQKNPFRKNVQGTSAGQGYPGLLPTTVLSGSTPVGFLLNNAFFDGVRLGDLRQRNFDLDMFTSAMPSAQKGNPQTVNMTVDTGTSATSFSIASLRAANSLQQFAERNQFSVRLQDYVRANYGANLSDGVAQRSLFLGRTVISVYSKGVEQTTPSTQDSDQTNNPFGNVGAEYGKAVIVGKGNLVDHFTAMEPGYLIVLATLVPKVTYSSGVLRQNFHYTSQSSQVDMPNPALQNVGNQPIYQGELAPLRAVSADGGTSVFGYSDRYYEAMTREDELHGLVRDGSWLQSFALQRTFTGSTPVTINDSFLKIPVTYLDQIAAATSTISQYGCWMDCYFNYKVVQPLAQYSIPSLQDPAYEHGETVKIKKGGRSIY